MNCYCYVIIIIVMSLCDQHFTYNEIGNGFIYQFDFGNTAAILKETRVIGHHFLPSRVIATVEIPNFDNKGSRTLADRLELLKILHNVENS